MKPTDLSKLDRDALVARIGELEAIIKDLTARVEELTRSGKRQAAPFSKGTPKEHPKKPDRKPGQGSLRRRVAPPPETLSEPPIEGTVAKPACSGRGGELAFERFDDASITDLPQRPRPQVRLYRVARHRCSDCGQTVRGRHPQLAADRQGTTAHRLGLRVLAVAHDLHSRLGVPVRKLPELLRLLTGITVTQGAITRDALGKAVGAIGTKYRQLCDSVRDSAYVHTDDTGWRQSGRPMWLTAFVTDTATVYQVRPRHRNEEVRERIPADYAGVMITDRAIVDDAAELAEIKQRKCLSHILRSLSEVLKAKVKAARWFASKLKGLLKRSLGLWHERRAGPVVADFATRVEQVKAEVMRHLRHRWLSDGDNQRLLNGLGRCHDAGAPPRFLDDPRIEPTNNRAERSLRPAVIARKVSQCTKTDRGTRAFEAWTSVLGTLSRAVSGPALLDAIVALVQPAVPQPN